ncbi:MAG TPA: cupredoxin family copper-binding protein [Terriglobia bacterium]|nr:cupredoxin family copper-binding protein [Terriglobia bacterium]
MKKLLQSFTTATFVLLGFGILKSSPATSGANSQKNSNPGYSVNIDNFSFAPATLTVPVGAKVTWTNKDDVPHTVVSTNNAFTHSPALDTDESFTYTFTKSGTYEYYCSVHPKMLGKIVVN